MNILELRHLRTIQALDKYGTLSTAAEHLFVTQSALSHQIKNLERRLGVEIYHRKSKPLKITNAGKALLELADQIIPRIRTIEDELTSIEQQKSGRLYMAIECHSCFDWLMPAIDLYRESWPDINLDFSTGFHFEPLPALLNEELDLVLTSDPEEIPGIYYHPVFHYESQLALSNSHELLKKKQIEPTDLIDQNLITYPVDKDRLDIYKHFLTPTGIRPKSERTAELTLMIIQLVASSRGVACLPNWVLREYLDRDLISVRKFNPILEGTLYFAIREDQKGSAFMKNLFEIVEEVCFKNLYGIRPCRINNSMKNKVD